MTIKTVILLTGFSVGGFLSGVSQAVPDTIELARSLGFQKNFTAADELLSAYSQQHTDINAMRLHVQILYWMKEFDRSAAVYETAITAFPEYPVLKLDYGRQLYDMGKARQASPLLQDYLATNPDNAEANLMMANIDHWNGNLNSANQRANRMLVLYPGYPQMVELIRQIQWEQTPWIQIGGQYLSDDQPLKRTTWKAAAGWYHSAALSPELYANFDHFNADGSNYHSLQILLSNRFYIAATGTTIELAGGVFSQKEATSNPEFIGKVSLSQKLGSIMKLRLAYDKMPYQYALASIAKPLLSNTASVALELNKNDNWLGKAALEQQHYFEKENVQTAYAWLLVPVYTSKIVTLQAGYSFSYAWADSNTYKPVLDGAIDGNTMIDGVYDPYFSPARQMIHAALAAINLKFNKQWTLRLGGNLGFYAKADIPYFYPQLQNGNNRTIVKEFVREKYTPAEFRTDLRWSGNKGFGLSAFYQYSQLLFYSNHQAGIQLKYAFIHE